MSSELEARIVAVERIIEYSKVKREVQYFLCLRENLRLLVSLFVWRSLS